MKIINVKNTGALIALTGLIFAAVFGNAVHFNPNPQVWFSPDYYIQFIPLYIAITFLLCGVFIFTGFSQVNIYLAVFGHATSEEIFFDVIGLTTTPLPFYAICIFLPLSLLALWLAYSNILQKEKVSIAEAIFGIVFSTLFILLPRFL
ncbi:hypothetical protein TDB9533_03896 [Thalassocella blandensis]|nr:hypothetical protein TDB9533_03896 [Thalassocella blandensis]